MLVSCVFSQQVWFTILQGFGSQDLTPQAVEPSFEEWWDNINKRVSGQGKKGLNSIIILGAWTLWNHRGVLLMELILVYPTSFQLLMRSGCSGLLLGLEEFLFSLPKHLQAFKRGVLYSWSGQVVSKSLVRFLVEL